MRLILIRHGQTVCNLQNVWHGQDECRLTETGVRQAEALAERLRQEPIGAIYCSDLPRAVETAEIVGRPHGIKPVLDPVFRERSAGEYQGLTEDEILRRNPNFWRDRDDDIWAWSPPQGETFRVVLDRVLTGIERIRAVQQDGSVALIGHMGTLRVLTSHLAGVPLSETYEMDFPSTGMSIFDLGPDSVKVEILNDGAHLNGEVFPRA